MLKWGRVWLEVMKRAVVGMQVEMLSKRLLTQALSSGGKIVAGDINFGIPDTDR